MFRTENLLDADAPHFVPWTTYIITIVYISGPQLHLPEIVITLYIL